jgi:acyl-CoA thioesterase-1
MEKPVDRPMNSPAPRYGPYQCRFNAARRLLRHTAGLLAGAMLIAVAAEGSAAAGERPVIAAFGDSLTAGYGLPERDSFAARLQAELAARGKQVRVINSGVSGDTTAGGRARLEWTLADEPDLVILELGANDGLRGIDPKETYDNLDAMLTRLNELGIPVVFAGMRAPPNLGATYGDAFNAVFPRLAEEHDVVFYPFFLDGVAAKPALNQEDGMHPNAAGVDAIVERILPYVEKALAQVAGL